MKILLLLAMLLAPVATHAQKSKASPDTLPDAKIDAAALLRDIVGNAPKSGSEVTGVLKIRSADGRLREVPVKWVTRMLTNQWHDVYQTASLGGAASETLIVVHREGATNHYELRRGETRVPEAAGNPFIAFAASDFWLADFGLEFLHWPNPKHLKTEMRKSRPCYVIESTSPRADFPYARVRSWIDTELGGLIRAEAYDKKGDLLKEFSIANIDRVNGRWRVKELLIRNDQTDTQTRLTFDLEVPESR